MASNGLSSDERVLETIFNPEHPIVGELHFVSIHKYTSSAVEDTNVLM